MARAPDQERARPISSDMTLLDPNDPDATDAPNSTGGWQADGGLERSRFEKISLFESRLAKVWRLKSRDWKSWEI